MGSRGSEARPPEGVDAAGHAGQGGVIARRHLRALVGAIAVLGIGLSASPAQAWRRVQDVVRGSADTLEKGRMTVGVFAPAMYGVNDSVTLSSHPLLNLLLVPNLDLRIRVVGDEAWVLAAYVGYKQSFHPALTSGVAGGLHLGAIGTRYLADRVALTVGAGYSGNVDRTLSVTSAAGSAAAGTDEKTTITDYGLSSGVELIAAATWLISEQHLLLATSNVRLDVFGVDRSTQTLAYAFTVGGVHLVLGIATGAFALRPISSPDPAVVAPKWVLPVFPYIDLWWDF